MNQRNWLDLDRKLVDKNDMEYTVDSMRQFVGASALSYFGEGVLPTTFFPNPFPITMDSGDLGGAVGNGIAYDPQGQFISVNSSSTDSKDFTISTADPTNPRWDLLVIRYEQDGQTQIPKPSDPIDTVFLNLVDGFSIVVIPGTASPTPAYPSKQPNDVILAGLKVPAGATLGTQVTVDLSVRELAQNNIVTFPVFQQEVPTGVIDGTNVNFVASQVPMNGKSILVIVDNQVIPSSEWSISGSTVTFGTAPATGQDVYFWYIASASSSENPLNAWQEIPTGVVDGSNNAFVLSKKTVDAKSVLVFVDDQLRGMTEWSLSQGSSDSIVFNPGFIPQPGQDVYVFYLINAIPGSPGSGGEVTNATNVGGGHDIFLTLVGSVLQFKTVKAGANMSITETDSGESLTFSSTGGGGGGAPGIYGDLVTPITFDPTAGLTIGPENEQIYFLKTSGGQQNVSAAKQISDGAFVGQRIQLVGVDATNYYTFQGNAGVVVQGLSMNGNCNVTNNQTIRLFWDGAKWYEEYRRN